MTAPAWVLLVLAPLIGELLSGSMPPVEWLNPMAVFFAAALYGGGAILCRELVLRWRKGWPSLLVFGIAYGIAEEGLMCKSFFDPGWGDIGPFGSYGRWAGVNWVWTVGLTGFHAVWSIAASIALVEIAYPGKRGAWVSRRAFRILAGLFVFDVVFGFLFISKYRPPASHVIVAVAVVAALVELARRLPRPAPAARVLPPVALFWLAFGWAAVWFGVFYVFPAKQVSAGWALAALGAVAAAGVWGFARWAAVPAPQHRLALASGVIGLFILLTPVQEMDTKRTDHPRGMIVAGLAAAAGLAWLARRVGRPQAAKRGARGSMAAVLVLLAAGTATARETGHADLLTKFAAVHARVESVAARVEVRMTHSVTGGNGPVPSPERYVFRVKAVRDPAAGEKAEEHWIIEAAGIKPRTELLRYSSRAVWTRSQNGQWARSMAAPGPGALKMLAVARGWSYQYLEDVPEHWPERAKVNILSGDYPWGAGRAWRLEIIPRLRIMQTAMAARWEVVMSHDGLPLYSRSTDRAGREVTVITSRDWRKVSGLPVSHDFTIVVRPPQERRPDAPDAMTTLDCRLSDVVVKLKR